MTMFRCGTCAWSDHEEYYPKGLPANGRLGYYASHFPLVEVDSSFYRLQPAKWYAAWAAKTPPGFVFNIKAYGAMTRHHREPRQGEADLGDVFQRFADSIEPMRESGKLKALHFQFPPWFTCSAESREWVHFCREYFRHDLVAVEFRHNSWFLRANREQTLRFLNQIQAINVICDEPQIGSGTVPAVVAVTDPRLSIVRFHGRNAKTWYIKAETTAQRFDYNYSQTELAEWVPTIKKEIAPGVDEVHLLMNNNRLNYAVRNALQLMQLLGLEIPVLDDRGVPATLPKRGESEQIKFF